MLWRIGPKTPWQHTGNGGSNSRRIVAFSPAGYVSYIRSTYIHKDNITSVRCMCVCVHVNSLLLLWDRRVCNSQNECQVLCSARCRRRAAGGMTTWPIVMSVWHTLHIVLGLPRSGQLCWPLDHPRYAYCIACDTFENILLLYKQST